MKMAVQLGLFLYSKFKLSIIRTVVIWIILSRSKKIVDGLKYPQRGWKMPFTKSLSRLPSWIKDFSGIVTFSLSRLKTCPINISVLQPANVEKNKFENLNLKIFFSEDGKYKASLDHDIKNFYINCDYCQILIFISLKRDFTRGQIQNYYRKYIRKTVIKKK